MLAAPAPASTAAAKGPLKASAATLKQSAAMQRQWHQFEPRALHVQAAQGLLLAAAILQEDPPADAPVQGMALQEVAAAALQDPKFALQQHLAGRGLATLMTAPAAATPGDLVEVLIALGLV
jgi:hypothetical protein